MRLTGAGEKGKMEIIGIRILCLVIGYLFGNFQTAYIIGRLNGIDIREKGSKNPGFTNFKGPPIPCVFWARRPAFWYSSATWQRA